MIQWNSQSIADQVGACVKQFDRSCSISSQNGTEEISFQSTNTMSTHTLTQLSQTINSIFAERSICCTITSINPYQFSVLISQLTPKSEVAISTHRTNHAIDSTLTDLLGNLHF